MRVSYVNSSQHIHEFIPRILDSCDDWLALLAIPAKTEELSTAEKNTPLRASGTIDMRVDYLRPNMGQQFVVHAELHRSGKRISVTRMKPCDTNARLIAADTTTHQNNERGRKMYANFNHKIWVSAHKNPFTYT